MSRKTNKSAKTVNANVENVAESPIAEQKNLSALLMEKFAKQLENVSENVKTVTQRSTVYIYPEIGSEDYFADVNSTQGKNWRNRRRKDMEIFASRINVTAKMHPEKLEDVIAEFDLHYKKFYRINDYSLASISQSYKRNENFALILALDIIKTVKGS